MSFYDKVVRFYMDITSGGKSMVNGKSKSFINISGKINFSSFCLYIAFSLFLICISMLLFSGTSSEAPDTLFEIILDAVYAKARNSVGTITAFSIIGISFVLITVIALIKQKLIFKRLEKKTTNINIYQRELPTKLKPAHVRMLLTDGKIDAKSLASTILDLIDRGYLELKRDDNSKEFSKLDIFKKGNIELYRTEKEINDLLSFEQYLIDWFINKCGDGKKITSKQLSEKIIGSGNDALGAAAFEDFQAHVMLSFPIDTFYDKTERSAGKMGFIIFCILIGFLSIIPIVSPILAIYGMATLFFNMPARYLNQTGVDEKDCWEDMRRYLLDFGDMKSKTPEQIAIWNFYLTYSIALGIDGIAGGEIEEFFGENIYFKMRVENEPTKTYTLEELKKMGGDLKSICRNIKNTGRSEIEKLAKKEMKKYDYYKNK